MTSSRPAARTFVAVACAVAVGAVSLVSAPGSTASDTRTTTTLASPGAGVVVFGGTVDVEVSVDSPSGLAPTAGTSTLLALESGSTEWVEVATSTSPGADFLDVRPWMNTTYKVAYSGSSDTGNGDTWAASESEPFTIGVKRRIVHPTTGFDLGGRVTPRYGRKVVVVRASRDKARGYTVVRTVRTDGRGRYSYVLPKQRGTWYWILRVKGDASYRGNAFAYQTNVF
ncbi:hypothetical protein ASG76_02030 [Nocardioides sp. Soil774]|uniref:hypothetical protein n=1 Tax=Nocardioides sp. Soil774 TaxID=1736408 RepID=UPI0006F7C9D3|nr:hypothetical protein [Nocardioides sp. Soil774]KRE97516.1 hypothetical protein ASG76_02030 [Nocardioides sp. Soil774]